METACAGDRFLRTRDKRENTLWPIFESRSNDYYTDSDSCENEPPLNGPNILLFPVLVLLLFPVLALFMLYLVILPFLVAICDFINVMLKRTMSGGKIAHPYLAYVGLLLAIALIANFIHPENIFALPSTTLILAIGFIVIFTVLPFLAQCLHMLIRLHVHIKKRSSAA